MKKAVSKSCFVLALMGAMATIFGCMGNGSTTGVTLDDSLEELPSYGYSEENTIRLCSDGLDNDGDTLIDCDDPGCALTASAYDPGNVVCKKNGAVLDESTDFMCSDGKDNDNDGYVDCRDRSCYTTLACCPTQITDANYESTLELCSDGADNDCDGYTDCSDKSCYKSSDASVKAYCEQKICKDKCTKTANAQEDEAFKAEKDDLCFDGKDNDNDGYIDCYDDGCFDQEACLLQLCSDGIDNDLTGYVDCKDNVCASLDYCTGQILGDLQENTPELCSDGEDNDLDGHADCDDSDCLDLQLDYCENLTPETGSRSSDFNTLSEADKVEVYKKEYTLCTDGEDNDHNGKKDCEEYRCQVLSLTDLSSLETKYNVKLNIECGL